MSPQWRLTLSETPWTVAHQASLSVDFPGKNTGVGCHSLRQGIFSTQRLNESWSPALQAYSLPSEPRGAQAYRYAKNHSILCFRWHYALKLGHVWCPAIKSPSANIVGGHGFDLWSWKIPHPTGQLAFRGGSDGKESTCQCRRPQFDPWVGTIPWRREWLPTLVFLSGKFHGQRSPMGYSPRSHKESDTTEPLSPHRATKPVCHSYWAHAP